MKVLLTGFEAFNKERINPGARAVLSLDDSLDGLEISKHILPTVFGQCLEELKEILDRERPDLVICVGQAGGRHDISLERLAINIDDASIEDNAGNRPIDQPIFPDGDQAYFSLLPVKRIIKDLRDQGIPASLSNTAGTYVCNHLMYGLLYYIDKYYPGMRGGFVHVPYIRQQVIDKPQTPFMEEELIVRALESIIRTSAQGDKDLRVAEGRTH